MPSIHLIFSVALDVTTIVISILNIRKWGTEKLCNCPSSQVHKWQDQKRNQVLWLQNQHIWPICLSLLWLFRVRSYNILVLVPVRDGCAVLMWQHRGLPLVLWGTTKSFPGYWDYFYLYLHHLYLYISFYLHLLLISEVGLSWISVILHLKDSASENCIRIFWNMFAFERNLLGQFLYAPPHPTPIPNTLLCQSLFENYHLNIILFLQLVCSHKVNA